MFRSRRRADEGFREPPSSLGEVKRARWPFLRLSLPPLLVALVFSFGLVSYSLLSHFSNPAYKQQLGWQAWETVHYESQKQATFVGEVASGNETKVDEGFVGSLPLDKWDPILRHTTGLKPCYFPPSVFPEYCAPDSTPEEDKKLGKWVRVDRDLNLRTGIWYLHIYYRRTRRFDVPLIDQIEVHTNPPSPSFDAEGWTRASGDLHSGTWPSQPELRMWYHTREPNSPGRVASDQRRVARPEIITEIDVLYGEGPPFFGFERAPGDVIISTEAQRWEQVSLTYRRHPDLPTPAPLPRFHKDGTFKIMQVADLHFSVGNGVCMETLKEPCVGDVDSLALMAQALDAEKPDLVVFSGDQLNGQKTSYDARSVLAKFATPVIDRKIPWAAVFGNHDSEIFGDRDDQMRWLQSLPYSLAEPGPKAVDGVGNYVIKLLSGDASRMHLFTLYFLDSHSTIKKSVPWAKSSYDYIKESQIQWFHNVSDSISAIERPFQPDGADDLDDLWRGKRRLSKHRDKTFAKPNALMFFHIPLPEAYAEADADGLTALDVGSKLDDDGASTHNSGMFYSGIKAEMEGEGSTRTEVKILAHGHRHMTDRCRRVAGIWQCFNGGSSYSGYGMEGFDRRFRIFELSDFGETVKTHKWLESGDVLDEQILVGDRAAPGVGLG